MVEQIIQKLHALTDPSKVEFKAQKFGVIANNALGIMMKDLNVIAQEIGKNSQLALELFDTDIYEARILCSKLFKPKDLTDPIAEKWVATFENWEICDSFCMGIVAKSPLARTKIMDWASREPEFEKRSGFATLAAYCMADKKASNEVFELLFPLIKREAQDNRIYVRKAVNWALRNIGKRNIDLNKKAIEAAKEILEIDSPTAKWIATDALRELSKDGVRMSDYPRSIYRV